MLLLASLVFLLILTASQLCPSLGDGHGPLLPLVIPAVHIPAHMPNKMQATSHPGGFSRPPFASSEYRVAHLLANLGWVDLDLRCSTILLGQ